ncbi:hypothetical protein BCR36DRAFT_364581 [Piromyces finnis]|uniref:Uncharacterized protein n=1 Tax=Piromyces finnis TaxID=1754191 RepID=A0A1Y1UV38_9FUNG|nr:hypothetical protein BCR36DRAFT_364581 [Piromyces finnis]|eukprot:ORX41336.1 hypothetical protein BCR36DRAFT_364581 [Piromyces finnis]
MADFSNTASSLNQSVSNAKYSNLSAPPKSRRNKSNILSKAKLNNTSKSLSSKAMLSIKQKKNKNRLPSKLLKQKTPTFLSPDEYINEVKGLSSEEALNRLLLEEERINNNEQKKRKILTNKAFIIITLLQLITIIVFIFLFITSTIKQKSLHYSIEYLIETILLTFWMFLNIIIIKHETEAYCSELVNKAKYVFTKIRTSGINMIQELRIPSTNSVSVLRVIRDGKSKTFPVSLLVKGDIVEITYGERIPCDAKYVPSERNKTYIPKNPILKNRQKFRPNFFESQVAKDGLQETTFNSSLFTFELLETPIHNSLESIFTSKRPTPPLGHQMRIIKREIFSHFFLYNFIIALAIALGRFLYEIIGNHLKENLLNVIIDYFLYRPLSAFIPLIFSPLIIGFTMVHVFGNSHILFMFEQLKKSKNEYKDDENIDEFDPAPAPTKDIHVSFGDVLKYAQSIFKTKKGTLLRSSSLLDTLGSITVICALDKEGTLSYPFPSIEQLFFIDKDGKSVILDVEESSQNPNGIRFEDSDWNNHLSSLKPLGLNLLLNTNCGFAEGKIRNDPHRRLSGLHFCGRTQSARQTCLCRLGREIGFSVDVIKSFKLLKQLYTLSPSHPSLEKMVDYHFKVPNMFSQIFEEASSGYQLITDGSVELVLDCCLDYWNGEDLSAIDRNIEKKILDFCQTATSNDNQIITYAYRPIHREEIFQLSSFDKKPLFFEMLPKHKLLNTSTALSNASNSNNIVSYGSEEDNRRQSIDVISTNPYSYILRSQIFLCLATLATHRLKQHVSDFVEDVRLAGIRFVYLSPAPERESKAFAERIGLETDWNSCILLSSDSESSGYQELHDIKAQLPRGIENIRSHIENVDDIPLHVSLFAECTPNAIKELIEIFQENGEVVCCIGSALNFKNISSFAIADVSVAIAPLHTKQQTKSKNQISLQSPLTYAADFISLPCSLFMNSDSSLYILTQIIRESRELQISMINAFFLLLGSLLTLSICYIFLYLLLNPPLFTTWQIIWLSWIFLPIISATLLSTPHDPETMTLMPSKNQNHITNKNKFYRYFIIRFILIILMVVLAFEIILTRLLKQESDTFSLFKIYQTYNKSFLDWDEESRNALKYAQIITLFLFVYYIIWTSATFVNRTQSIFKVSPIMNHKWFIVSILMLILHIGITLINLDMKDTFKNSLGKIPFYYHLLFIIWPIALIPAHEFAKKLDRKEYTRCQKRTKLEFNTKVGMHSPL